MWSCRQLTTLRVVVQVECELAHITLSLREPCKGKMNSVLQILRNCSTPPLQNSLSACSHSVARKRELPVSAIPFRYTPFYRQTSILDLKYLPPSAPQGGTHSPRNYPWIKKILVFKLGLILIFFTYDHFHKEFLNMLLSNHHFLLQQQ